MSPPEGLDRLLALEEIRALPLRYAAAIEARDVDAMAALFSPDARFGAWGDGPAGLRALMTETLGDSVFAVILVANHLIDLTGGEHARGQVWARCYAQNRTGGFVEQLIRYDDTYVAVGDRWLFLHRRHRLWLGAEVAPSPLDQAPANWPERQVGVGDIPLADPAFVDWRDGH
jgi:hypothetical protein